MILYIIIMMIILNYLIIKADEDSILFMNHETSELFAFIIFPILSQIFLLYILKNKKINMLEIFKVPFYSSIIGLMINILYFIFLYNNKYNPPMFDGIFIQIILFWLTTIIFVIINYTLKYI